MQLEDVPRLGAKRAGTLRAVGIKSVKDLAEVDLRKLGPIEGISSDAFRQHKADARKLLDKEGIPYAKSPYRANKPASAKPATEPATTTRDAAKPRRGFLRRLFARS